LIDVDITRKGFKCGRCGFEWLPRKEGKAPKQCPKCRSAYWNKPRTRRRRSKEEKEVTKRLRKQGTSIKEIARQLSPRRQIVHEELRETREGERRKR
jgi:transposase-like protein